MTATIQQGETVLDPDIIFDDLIQHEADARQSYLLEPADVVEQNLREMGQEPRQADKSIIEDGYIPHRLQMIVHKELMKYRFFVLVCHRRFGKTVLAVNALCHAAVKHTPFLGKPGRFAYIAPLRSQAKAVAWMYLKAFAARVEGARKNEGELYVEFPNGSRITLYGANLGQADALRGLYLDGCVFDEPSQMEPAVWQEVVRAALADHRGWCLFIGTPKGINLFSEIYDRAGEEDDWGRMSFPITDTIDDLVTHSGIAILDDDEVESLRRGLSENQFRQEMMCDFGASSSDVIITLDQVDEAMKRSHKSTKYLEGMEKVVGIDPAWMGDDKTVVAFRWGLEMFPLKRFDRESHDQIVGYLSHIKQEYDPDAWFCDQAYSEGIYALCEQVGIPLNLVAFGSTALDPTQYANRVTEMYFRHGHWLKSGGKLPDDYRLKGDLTSVTYEFVSKTHKGKTYDVRQRHKKKEIKKKIQRSPDDGDACVLTTCEIVASGAAREIADSTGMQQGGNIQVSDGGYHPHKRLDRTKNHLSSLNPQNRPKTPRRR